MHHLESISRVSTGLAEGHRWVVARVESSGTRLTSDRVVHLCVLAISGEGVVEDEFVTPIDPGPDFGLSSMHHRLRDRLAGAPHFEDVTDRIIDLLEERTLVAYDAATHYGFLDAEFRRADIANPVRSRLCVRTLSRRLELDVPNLRLMSLAGYLGIEQKSVGNRVRDEANLVGQVFMRSAALANSLGLSLPIVDCVASKVKVPKLSRRVPCRWINPGGFNPDVGLIQGTKVAISGATASPRDVLEQKMIDAGLDVMGAVGSHVGLVICNDTMTGSPEVLKLLDTGTVSVIPEKTLEYLIKNILPGIPRMTPTQAEVNTLPAVGQKSADSESAGQPDEVAATGPVGTINSVAPSHQSFVPKAGSRCVGGRWQHRHVLVVGGTHEDAARTRSQISRLGGVPAINLSAAVTHLLVLDADRKDQHSVSIGSRDLPVLTLEDLKNALKDGTSQLIVEQSVPEVRALTRGEAVDLRSENTQWKVHASWRADSNLDGITVDIVGFMLSDEEIVTCDEDFVFYNHPRRNDGAMDLTIDGNCEQGIYIDLEMLPAHCVRVVIAAAVEEMGSFGQLGPVAVKVETSEKLDTEFVLDAGTTERTMVLCEVYRRADTWRLRAVGQGYDDGLDALAILYGVDVE